MLVLGFDTETTGLNTSDDHIIQVGAVLWDTEAKKKKAKIKYDALVKGPHLTKIDPGASEANGLTLEEVERYGITPAEAFGAVNALFDRAEAIVAHNGNLFDRPMLESNCARHGLALSRKLWIDTTCDIEYPGTINTRKLSYLATEHGFMNPFPHDAISDVLTMLRVADCYDWGKALTYAKAPTLVVRADSTFQQKELVKKQNYRWDFDNKQWVKSIKEFQLEDARKAAQTAGFKVTVLSNPRAEVKNG